MLLGSIIIIDQRNRDSKELQCQLQIELFMEDPKARGCELLFAWQRAPGYGDLWPRQVTLRHVRSWGLQTFTRLDCEGVKAQGFLCSGVPPWTQLKLLFCYSSIIKLFKGLNVWDSPIGNLGCSQLRRPGVPVWVWQWSCEGASVPAQRVWVWLLESVCCKARQGSLLNTNIDVEVRDR